jgi:uncharacterized protein (DUF1786 family)
MEGGEDKRLQGMREEMNDEMKNESYKEKLKRIRKGKNTFEEIYWRKDSSAFSSRRNVEIVGMNR